MGLLEAIIERPVSANPLVKKGVHVVRRESGSGWLFAGCWQLMSAHLQIIRVLDPRYLQLIWIENRAVCRSACGCLQASIVIPAVEAASSRFEAPGWHFYELRPFAVAGSMIEACLQAATASQATGVHSRILLNLL